ncbi:nickel/cobalt efflux transporter [Microvirga sp. VF16]|uniref:nickel/cobalt efflux transporter n=1 Tax=Microvirga sp. VF16 TaxID=2807101 RepID=UPI00193CBA65|nr:nickel/cobalt efflux transporter [Microvirga sp. VF16]QRM27850.1 nickel/cobalt efflux transporter RcnA [Microvirga sp. VF16]
MPDLAGLIQAGAANPWLYLPAAILLGALHALEPGHSKSMMAAFIVAVRGTPAQATLLGISAAIGHTIVVWALALLGLYLGDKLILDRAEPWLVLLSGLLIMALAFRIFWMLRAMHHHGHDHDDHGHETHHRDHDHHDHHHHDEPRERLDAHAAAHAHEVRQRFGGNRNVTNFDIAWFGFTGGLLPCPAAIAVLLICLQLRAFTLGISMVAAFSIGLAITLIAVGVFAAWGTRVVRARWARLEEWGERLPYVSAALVFVIGTIIALQGLGKLGLIA